MNLSWKIGRVAGIDLYLHVTFVIMLGAVALWQGGWLSVALVAALFGCVLLHELGHALMARRFGIPTRDITLYPIGGVARLRRMPRDPMAELLIALAGPAVNVAIAGALAAALGLLAAAAPTFSGTLPALLLGELMRVNLILAAFNLLPAFPMDGGRVLRATLSSRWGRLRATEVAAGVGRLLAVGFGIFCLANGLFVQAALAAFVFVVAGAELRQVRVEERGRRPILVPTAPLRVAPTSSSWIDLGDGVPRPIPLVILDDPGPDGHFPRGARPWL